MNDSPPRILVVDDNLDLADTLALQLQHSGHPALARGSVRDALDALDEDPSIRLVITDIRMPEVDGLDFRRVLKHRFPALPVVLMTGLPLTEEDMVPPQIQVLQKPFSLDVLLRAVAKTG
jgi:DNA-binding NtrC family response regulator